MLDKQIKLMYNNSVSWERHRIKGDNMTVDSFIRTFKDIEVYIRNDTNRSLIEIILPNINYMFYRFNYEQISHMSEESAFFIAYGVYKTLILLESTKCKEYETKMSGKERGQSNMEEEKK